MYLTDLGVLEDMSNCFWIRNNEITASKRPRPKVHASIFICPLFQHGTNVKHAFERLGLAYEPALPVKHVTLSRKKVTGFTTYLGGPRTLSVYTPGPDLKRDVANSTSARPPAPAHQGG
jgi:hypothetical protein